MKRQCIYCGEPIYECMGYVIPRDVLAILDGVFPAGQMARELCPSSICNSKWNEQVENDIKEAKIRDTKN